MHLKKEAEKESIEINIKAVGTGAFTDEIKGNWNLVLVAPQVRHRYDGFKAMAKEEGIPIELIPPPQSYSPLGGPKLMEQIKKIFIRGIIMEKFFLRGLKEF